MKVKRNFISIILLIVATIMMTTDSKGTSSLRNKLSNAKNSFINTLKMSEATIKNWKTSSNARNFNKAVGFAPIIKEDNVNVLLELMANEADLIKLGAFKKLSQLFKNAKTEENKKILILAKLQGTIELIKYYGVAWNCPKVKFTFLQGMYYARTCKKLYKNKNPIECLRKEIQLYAAFISSFKVEDNRIIKIFLNSTKKKALQIKKDDETINFIDTKIACEIKFAQDNKNIFLRTAMKLYMGTSNKNKDFNCVTELLKYKNDLSTIDSYTGEFYYLLARAYGYQNDYKNALENLYIARDAEVVDSKTRETNKKIQAYFEKIYTRLYAK